MKKGRPLGSGERQDSAARIHGMPDVDVALTNSDLYAFARTRAPGALLPPIGIIGPFSYQSRPPTPATHGVESPTLRLSVGNGAWKFYHQANKAREQPKLE